MSGNGRPSNPDGAVVDALVQVSFQVMAVLTRCAADHDLSLTQLRMLAILRDRTPKMAELADHLGLEKSTVSGLIDRAGRRGLVERFPEPDDARAVRVGLSADGQTMAAALTGEVDELLTPLLRRLTTGQHRRLGALLDSLSGR